MSQETASQIKLLRRTRQVRDYRPEPVPEDALADILEVGRWSGSANNRQTSEIVVVRNPEARQILTEGGANTAASAAVALVIVTLGDPAREELEVFDEGRMSERLLIAATAHGLGASITTLKGEGPAAAKKALGIPAERRVKTVVAVGVPDDAAIRAKPKNPQPRKPIGEFAHWDRF